MSNHEWRQGHGIDPMREWMRRELPGSKDGLGNGIVLVDLDLALRRYGRKYGSDSMGDLLLIEKKEYHGEVTFGEKFIYNWISEAANESANKKTRWRGWYVLRVVYKESTQFCPECKQPIEDKDEAFARFCNAKIYIDEKEMSHEQLREWLVNGTHRSAK